LKQKNLDITTESVGEIQKRISHESLRRKNDVDHPQPKPPGPGVAHVGADEKTRMSILMTSPKSINANFSGSTVALQNRSLINDVIVDQPNNSADPKKINQKQRKLFVKVGIGLQQQIPIAGQAVAPYSYNGTKGYLPDYLPHVYAQLQKENKWFVEGDFKFGMAQSVDEFSYSQKTIYDSATKNLTVTTMNLMETYYHDLSFSFNYFLLRNLSFGVGGIYSRFHGAISEQEISTSNIPTQTNSSVKQIIPMKHFTDSFLYRNQLRVLMQASYEWKRLSFSLRYAKDIQPYIKYTRPDGTVNEKKNQSLQFLLRYKLWQTRRF
jgi:hypothetical protein